MLTASAGVPGEKSVAGLHRDGIVDLHILTPLHLRADHMGRTVLHTTQILRKLQLRADRMVCTVLHTTQILRKFHLRADLMVSTILHTTQILRKFHLRADHTVNTILHTTQILRKTGCNMNSCLHCNLTLRLKQPTLMITKNRF